LIEGPVDLGSNGHIVPALVSLVYTFTQSAGEMDVETHCKHSSQFTKEESNQAEFVISVVEAVLMQVMKESGQGLVIQKEGISAKARQIARERLGLE
jgi:hypothetical protein